MTLFTELPLHKQLIKALDKAGFTEATKVQAQVIPEVLGGRDVMVSSKTGSGKTAAFMLPMLERFLAEDKPNTGTRGLILLPTRELALQMQKTFATLAAFTRIKSGLIIGGEAYKHQVAMLRKNPEVIIATPGRLIDHIDKGNTDFQDLEVLVLDEADRMLDMGFSEAMNTIARASNSARQNLLFSATLKHRGMSKIDPLLQDPRRLVIDGGSVGHSQITQQRVLADDDKHKQKLLLALINEEQASKVLVFCNTRQQCQQLGNVLRYEKLQADYIHGELSQSERKQVLNRFRDNKLQVLVATDVAARGLDINNIELVINFSVAQSGDDHVHRIGRTGRAGAHGCAITLVNAEEWPQMSSIERYLKVRFEPRKVPGLQALYKGPKKVKNSGKIAGPKKKKRNKIGKSNTKSNTKK